VDARALATTAASISVAERRAMKAERETADRLIAHFLADRIGARFSGHISGVTRAGLFVELDDTGADGLVPARFIGDEYFRFDEKGRAFVGRSASFRLGDPVTVELVEAAPVAGALRFKVVEGSGAPDAHRLRQKPPRGGLQHRHPARKSRRGKNSS
jgi:ribonuclease R